MTIETKFNDGDKVIVIENNRPYRGTINSVEYFNGCVQYWVLLKKAPTLLDSDHKVQREESQVYSEITDIKLKE